MRPTEQRSAERRLDKYGWNYRLLIASMSLTRLDASDRLSALGKGRYIGILEAELARMKDERGLK
jgi:hypothetical protein